LPALGLPLEPELLPELAPLELLVPDEEPPLLDVLEPPELEPPDDEPSSPPHATKSAVAIDPSTGPRSFRVRMGKK
jgi:hypothetical protein